MYIRKITTKKCLQQQLEVSNLKRCDINKIFNKVYHSKSLVIIINGVHINGIYSEISHPNEFLTTIP